MCYFPQMKNLHMSDQEFYDLKKKCECKKEDQKPIVINYDPMWRDGEVVCDKCKSLIRDYDAG